MLRISVWRKGAAALATTAALSACSADVLTAPNDAPNAVPNVSPNADASRLSPGGVALSVAPTRPAGRATAPTLPKYDVPTAYPSVTGRTIKVQAGDDLQDAIDSARLGDQILLQSGATFTGSFRLRKKTSGSGYIVIKTDGALPAEGERMTPTRAGAKLAKLVTPNSGVAVYTDPGAHHYRLVGLEITASAKSGIVGGLVNLGDGSSAQNTLAEIPAHIVLDRVWIHGTPTMELHRCVSLQSAWTAIVDSYIEECHSNAVESQAIVGWNGPGPFKIVNNYVEGSDENIMFGGANPANASQMPSDITIQRNHFSKPVGWKDVWRVKNTFELKFAQRVLVEENVIENSWVDGQTGYVLNIKTNSAGPTWLVTKDVTFRYNVIRNGAGGLSLAANPDGRAIGANRILFTQNVFTNIGTFNGTRTNRMLQIMDDLKDITITHNTFVPNTTNGTAIVLDGDEIGSNLYFADNVIVAGAYGIASSGYGDGSRGLDHYWSSYSFKDNLLVNFNESVYPSGNSFADDVKSSGLVVQPDGSLAFASAGVLAAAGTSGSTPGADVPLVHSMTAGVVIP